jgi:Zn-dependent protease with chaperone function
LIIDKLPTKHIDKTKIKIFIAGDLDPNAYNINRGVPLLVIHKGLLDFVETEDELAGVIAHELMHIDLHSEFPEHSNSKAEDAMRCGQYSSVRSSGL